MSSLQQFIVSVTTFIGNVLVPFLFALALLFFIYNAFRYFILGANEEDAKTKAKQLALYGIIAFVLLLSIWGIVNMLVFGLGFQGGYHVTPDYFDEGIVLPGGELGPGPTNNSSGWGDNSKQNVRVINFWEADGVR